MTIKIDELCTQLIVIISTVMLSLCGLFGIETMKYCIYAIVVLSFLKLLYIRITPFQLIAFACLFLSSMFILALHGGSLSSLIVSLSSVIFAISIFAKGVDEATWKLIKLCTYVVAVAFILYMIFAPAWTDYDQLSLYFENPNMTGIALCAPAMMLVLMLYESKRILAKGINLILLAVLAFMIYTTQNRSSFFSLLFLLVIALLMALQRKERRIASPVFFGLLKLTPIFVMFVYIGMFLVLPDGIEVLGKPLFSGREGSWLIALKDVLTDPLAYHAFEEGTLNLFLEGAARYGILSMFAYFGILISFGKRKNELKKMSSLHYLAYVAFHCCLFQQSFESTLFTGSYTVYVWSYLLLGVASMRFFIPHESGELEET